jgi:CubicO group peptidase (beta-lactamase class C family)
VLFYYLNQAKQSLLKMKTLIKNGRILSLFGIILFLAAGCWGQEAAVARVDDFIKTEMQKQKIPGVSLAVVKNGEIILAKGYGFSNLEHQAPVKAETIFQSGSVGKQFTATAVMILVEEGKISLDEKINKYLGEVPESWQNITVRHLLTHTSGMTDYPSDFDFRRDYTEDELLTRAKAVPTGFQPGEKWQYSNLAYVTLGIIIHKVSGKFYGDFLQDRIFKPLQMTTARIISEAEIIPHRAAGYTLVKNELKNQQWVSPSLNTTADGALYLNVYDMAKWDAALYGEKLLKKTSLDQMWSPVKLNNGKTHPYGFGWALGEVSGHRIIEHGGAWQGFKSFIARYPNDKLTVIVFANLSQANPTKLARGVAGIYNAELIPPPAATIEDKEPQVTAFLKDVLQKFAAGTIKPEIFTPEMNAVLFPEVVKQIGASVKAFGTLESVGLLSRSEENGLRVYRYRLQYPSVKVLVRLALTRDDKIAGLNSAVED